MSKKMSKRLAALATAGVLALALAPAAAFGVGALTPDNSITVGGLDEGDSASYYWIVQQDNDSVNDNGTPGDTSDDTTVIGTKNWKLTEAVDSDGDGIVDGTESEDFGHKDADGNSVNGLTVDELVIKDATSTDTKVITAKMANAIASAVTVNEAAGTNMGTANSDGEVSAVIAQENLGLYMVVAIPGTDNITTVYKPVFVSADYDQVKNTDSLTIEANETDYQDNNGTFKRSTLSIDKKSGARNANGNLTVPDSQHDVAVGDVVDFTITVPMPTYSLNYTDPKFDVTDVLTTGLELVPDSVQVVVKNSSGATISDMAKKGKDFTITEGKNHAGDSIEGFVVKFLNDDPDVAGTQDGILYKVLGAPTVTITYRATVTSAAAEQVNQMDNTATLNFSNQPTDTTGAGELKDKTRHYTFSVDANVFGQGAGDDKDKVSEIRKIGIDANGNVIEESVTTELDGNKTDNPFEWLQDAEFELTQTQYYQTNDDLTGQMKALDSAVVVKFDADGVRSATGTNNPKSDANGYIPMKGLDAGVYQLKEISAPLGWAFDPAKVYTITITPTYKFDADDNDVLSKYEVKINFTDEDGTAQESKTTYTAGEDAQGHPISFLNEDGTPNTAGAEAATITVDPASETALIVNKKLGILPATGGSGIFFYLGIGAAIMALAVALAHLRRRSMKNAAGAQA